MELDSLHGLPVKKRNIITQIIAYTIHCDWIKWNYLIEGSVMWSIVDSVNYCYQFFSFPMLIAFVMRVVLAKVIWKCVSSKLMQSMILLIPFPSFYQNKDFVPDSPLVKSNKKFTRQRYLIWPQCGNLRLNHLKRTSLVSMITNAYCFKLLRICVMYFWEKKKERDYKFSFLEKWGKCSRLLYKCCHMKMYFNITEYKDDKHFFYYIYSNCLCFSI